MLATGRVRCPAAAHSHVHGPPAEPIHALRPDGRYMDHCESTELAMQRAIPRLWLDLADSAMMTCYHCGRMVCIQCQKAPVEDLLAFCEACDQSE